MKPVKKRELLDVNRVHFILEKAEDYETLVSDLNSLCLERGVTESEMLAYRYSLAHANRFDPADVIYVKRMLQHALPENLRNDIASGLFSKYVGLSESDFAEEMYLSFDDTKRLVNIRMQEAMDIGICGLIESRCGPRRTKWTRL